MPLSLTQARRRQLGFTLTELAIAMGVIGMVIGAIWWASSNAREAQKSSDAVAEVQTVTQNILSLMGGQSFGGAARTDITASMITAQAVPTIYVDSATPTTIDHAWSLGNFVIWSMSPKTFRISLYNVSYRGCVNLLSQLTACQSGQVGCPSAVYTKGTFAVAPTLSCVPGNCSGTVNAARGWQVLGLANATTLCAGNNYDGGTNSVEFDYGL